MTGNAIINEVNSLRIKAAGRSHSLVDCENSWVIVSEILQIVIKLNGCENFWYCLHILNLKENEKQIEEK